MKHRTLLCLLVSLSVISAAIGAPPENKRGKGPPPWAPAHGARAKFSYRYFPGTDVYQRTSDGVWFYYENGKWAAGARLPAGIEVNVGSSVTLEMDADKPYLFHRDVKASFPSDAPVLSGKPSKGKGAAN